MQVSCPSFCLRQLACQINSNKANKIGDIGDLVEQTQASISSLFSRVNHHTSMNRQVTLKNGKTVIQQYENIAALQNANKFSAVHSNNIIRQSFYCLVRNASVPGKAL